MSDKFFEDQAEAKSDAIKTAIPDIDHHDMQFVLDEHKAGNGIKAIAESTRSAMFFRPAGGLTRKQVRLIIERPA